MYMIINIMNGSDLDLKIEALFIIGNATRTKNIQTISKIAAFDILPILIDILKFEDSRHLMLSLETINNILKSSPANLKNFEELQGINTLERLQTHSNPKIYEKVAKIMSDHYGLDDVTDVSAEYIIPNNFNFS